MKKIYIAISVIFLALAISGCGNDQYAIEKQYWQAQRQAEKIFKNPNASPPRELQRIVSALDTFAKKYSKNILSVEAEFSIAKLYIVKEEYEKARSVLKELINKYNKSEPACAEALFLIGNSYEIQNKWQEALLQYKKIMQQYPVTIRGLNVPIYIAQHYKIKYQPDLMISALQEAIAYYKGLSAKYPLTPLAFNTDILVAQCYMAMKEWQSAINALNHVVETYKNKLNAEQILLNIAVIYEQQLKNRDKAKETLQKFIKDYPKSKLTKPATELLKKWEETK